MSQKQGYAPYLNVFLLLLKNERYICSPSPAIEHTSFALSLATAQSFPDKNISI